MSFTHNGQTWTPQTTQAHANEIMSKINTLLQDNSITDETGAIVKLSPSFSNVLYLLVLGTANIISDFDAKLAKAINSFNLELCDDQQILNLLPIAGTTQGTGTFSTLMLTCKASETTPCTIPAGAKVKFENVFFTVTTTTVILANETKDVLSVCDTVGAIVVLSGEIKSFKDPIPNLKLVTNPKSSTPGKAAETINDLRRRLIIGDTIKTNIDGCKTALSNLAGVNYAKVYFNYNITEPLILNGGIRLKPRHAYIVIHGHSDLIAETFAMRMNSPTQNADGAPAQSQIYTTESGQQFPVFFDNVTEQEFFVKLFLEKGAESGQHIFKQMKKDIIESSVTWEIGQSITQALITKTFAATTYTKIAYAQVSLDGVTWSSIIWSGANVLPRIIDTKIIIEQLS